MGEKAKGIVEVEGGIGVENAAEEEESSGVGGGSEAEGLGVDLLEVGNGGRGGG